MRAAATICIAVVLFVSAWSDASGDTEITPSVRAALLEQALKTARRDGDRHPYDIEAVKTTREDTTHILPGAVQACEPSNGCPDTPVYVVAMRGHFTCGGCSVPRGAPVPHGTVITLEIDATTMLDGAFALNGRYPKLSTLGVVVSLSPRRRRA